MMLALAFLALKQPFAFQKETAAENLIRQIATPVVHSEHLEFFDGTDCQIWQTDLEVNELRVPGQLLPGKVTMLNCTFPTSCGTNGERVVFHTEYFGAWKPAESFYWTVGAVCGEMLIPSVYERLPQHLREDL